MDGKKGSRKKWGRRIRETEPWMEMITEIKKKKGEDEGKKTWMRVERRKGKGRYRAVTPR